MGMAYLLGDWATERRAITVVGQREDRLISSMFDISPPTDRPATTVSSLVGMAF